jgi:curved DNA-binding protein CbpA
MDELKKIRKKSVAKLHPDKGGDEEEFKMVNDAFDALLKSYKVEGYKSYETLLKERYDEQRKALAEAAKADKAKKK